MQYIKTIAVFLIVVNLLMTLINHDSYKKYMKIFSGLILVLMITKQVRYYFSSGIIENAIDKKMQEYEIAEISNSLDNINEDIGEKAKHIYEEKIADEISLFLEKENIEVRNVAVQMSVKKAGLAFEKVIIELDNQKNVFLSEDGNYIYEAGEINVNYVSEVRREYVNQLISKEYGIESELIHISN